jgi:hypothetical protein
MDLEGGDPVDELINDVEADEEGMDISIDDEDEFMDYDGDGEEDEHEGDHEELEDRVVDLEDKLDELMAEFDDLIGGEEMPTDEMGLEPEMEEGMYESKDEVDEDEEVSEEDAKEDLDESAELVAAPKPVSAEEASVNTKSANADDAGKKAKTDAKPVSTSTSTEKGRTAPKAKDMDVDGPEGGAELTKV